ncbi:MAG TPA: tRNA (adenosine(37)-N6)-threonylcarbamoyltransferase complex ATPase subunit type 1 TsaE [Acidimicrobiales bacterium]|nr:tRNA (adenosine(37)-N6)-threonylcarbamoyltransferase complex ATPase subunit type 1 TsaE [Acidimicrobiales bacterium]
MARTTGAEHTKAVGAALAGVLAPGDVVLLVGDLGAGKTTFAQGLAAGLGVDEAVTSPTFTLVRPYLCAGAHRGVRTMLHADLYRLDSWQEVADLALGEMVEDGAVAIVEWGDVAEPVLGPDPVTVRLAPGPSDEERTVSIALPARHRPHLESLRAQVLSAGTAA